MIIRTIKENELDRLMELYNQYTSQENVPSLSVNKIKEIWKQIESTPLFQYFVLESDNVIVAASILSITPSFIRGGDAYGLIEHVITGAEYRRKGFGQAIVNYILNYAWEKGCTEVMLLSGSANEKAHKMYEKIGFDKNRKKGFIIYKPD